MFSAASLLFFAVRFFNDYETVGNESLDCWMSVKKRILLYDSVNRETIIRVLKNKIETVVSGENL